ncbi:MAG: signal peptidase II [Candidatus Hydrogenedentes bacterium]|nr:signal peptidase II [Candidatus Hydrogenedentota bacterium]
MTYKERVVLIAWIVGVCLVLDQATKRMAIAWLQGAPPHIFLGDVFRLQYAENTGAFLGLFGQMSEFVRSTLLIGFNSVILVVVSVFLFVSRNMARLVTVALALILAGGIGNLIDRVVYGGYVVDFMNLGLPWVSIRGWEPRTGIFNIADVAIMAGLGLMVAAEFLRAPDEGESPVARADDPADS